MKAFHFSITAKQEKQTGEKEGSSKQRGENHFYEPQHTSEVYWRLILPGSSDLWHRVQNSYCRRVPAHHHRYQLGNLSVHLYLLCSTFLWGTFQSRWNCCDQWRLNTFPWGMCYKRSSGWIRFYIFLLRILCNPCCCWWIDIQHRTELLRTVIWKVGMNIVSTLALSGSSGWVTERLLALALDELYWS